MDWMNSLQDILSRYSGQGAGAAAAPADPHGDFQEVAKAAPQEVIAGGISQAFRSEQTPPFAEMLAKLFRNSDGTQRADLLNRLAGSIDPETLKALPGLSSVSGAIGRGPGGPGISSESDGLRGSGNRAAW